MVGIVLRTLEDLERVLWVVNEVLVLRPFPLRLPHIQAEVLHHPAFEFSTSVNSVELNLLVGSSPPFDFQIKNLFAEVLYSIVITKTLTPPTTIPSPEPSPGPIIIIPPPSPPPPPPPPGGEGGGDGGNGTGGGDEGLVTWNAKLSVYVGGISGYLYLVHLIAVSREGRTPPLKHYEERQGMPLSSPPLDDEGLEFHVTPISVSVTKTSLSKTWNVQAVGANSGIVYANENVTVTVPPFNGQDEQTVFPWYDIQTHIV
jgi:hypothetical protein